MWVKASAYILGLGFLDIHMVCFHPWGPRVGVALAVSVVILMPPFSLSQHVE